MKRQSAHSRCGGAALALPAAAQRSRVRGAGGSAIRRVPDPRRHRPARVRRFADDGDHGPDPEGGPVGDSAAEPGLRALDQGGPQGRDRAVRRDRHRGHQRDHLDGNGAASGRRARQASAWRSPCPRSSEGEVVYFPTIQKCEKGETRWIEIPADGRDRGGPRVARTGDHADRGRGGARRHHGRCRGGRALRGGSRRTPRSHADDDDGDSNAPGRRRPGRRRARADHGRYRPGALAQAVRLSRRGGRARRAPARPRRPGPQSRRGPRGAP